MVFGRYVVWVLLVMGGIGLHGSARAQDTAPASAPSAAPSPDDEARARDAFQRGRIHYDNGDFDRAAAAFEEAYRLSNRHPLLYNLYLAYRDANQPDAAARALANYLALVDAVENRSQLEARLRALEEGLAKQKQQQEAEQQAKEEQEQKAAPASESPQSAGPQKRWWITPVAVMGAGAALMVGSLATGMMTLSKEQQLKDDCTGGVCDPSLKSTADSGKTLAIVTDVLLFGGVATAATGAVLFFLKKPKAEATPSKTATNVHCSTRACGASLSVRF